MPAKPCCEAYLGEGKKDCELQHMWLYPKQAAVTPDLLSIGSTAATGCCLRAAYGSFPVPGPTSHRQQAATGKEGQVFPRKRLVSQHMLLMTLAIWYKAVQFHGLARRLQLAVNAVGQKCGLVRAAGEA